MMGEATFRDIVAWLQSRAPCITAASAGSISNLEPFDEAEAVAVARAVKKRRDEFHTGRRLARTALARLGCAPASICIGRDRVPIWPPGFLGSISHAGALCLAHVARVVDLIGIGVDIEPLSPLPVEVARLISRPEELALGIEQADLVRFVTKEAFFKAYYPAARVFLDFHHVRIEIDSASSTFLATIVAEDKPSLGGHRAFEGHFVKLGGYYLAALWIPA